MLVFRLCNRSSRRINENRHAVRVNFADVTPCSDGSVCSKGLSWIAVQQFKNKKELEISVARLCSTVARLCVGLLVLNTFDFAATDETDTLAVAKKAKKISLNLDWEETSVVELAALNLKTTSSLRNER